jgi:predicted RNA binding protein YcfA (HicA-like mRNA interferase family)/predicted RNase H-like HicB family nuclease
MEVNMTHQFDVIVEKDSAGYFVASVPALPGCHTQAKSLDTLMERIREAIELCLEVDGDTTEQLRGATHFSCRMTSLPSLTGKDLLSVLKKAGFELLRVKGSHHFLRHEDGRSTVVPVHSGETIGPGLLAKILRDCDLNREQFQKFL